MQNTTELISLLVNQYGWSKEQLQLGLRADFRCEYCGKDLLESIDNYFWIWQVDHIKPSAKDGGDGADNMAVSCLTCNLIKRDWWDRRFDGASERNLLLHAAKQYVSSVRDTKSDFLRNMRDIITQLKSSIKENDEP